MTYVSDTSLPPDQHTLAHELVNETKWSSPVRKPMLVFKFWRKFPGHYKLKGLINP